MYVSFDELPKQVKARLIREFGLSETESELLSLRYVEELSYAQIAARMCVSQSSVGTMLTRARRHVVRLARRLYPFADEWVRGYIDLLGWRVLEWPVIGSRNAQPPIVRVSLPVDEFQEPLT